eukprot:CAMPEP_0175051918 /NCGR_PEP_ID=MMETSP0052_2-20121109/8071_1 /TAXON_ID=51329 ORGANISM="Polytomella parva, Strain SAG 63-3" /NCGR_SAMPLE_ID=MMETSP0052_2 /ASSEMBLY_ACC=CAM_ASM_000194 /LENGTH=103 /DNA_ID=CAMNT_0016316265 /DNA_START=1037 /DNA_END=1348 /DNA_ORIENTATION=+
MDQVRTAPSSTVTNDESSLQQMLRTIAPWKSLNSAKDLRGCVLLALPAGFSDEEFESLEKEETSSGEPGRAQRVAPVAPFLLQTVASLEVLVGHDAISQTSGA